MEVLAYAKIGKKYLTLAGTKLEERQDQGAGHEDPRRRQGVHGRLDDLAAEAAAGPWTLQVRAVDPAGNLSGWTTLKVKIKS